MADMDGTTFAFIQIAATLVLGPPIGMVLAVGRYRARASLFRRLCIGSVVVLLLLAASLCLGVQTISTAINVGFCLLAYLAYCFLASACWRLRPHVVGSIAGAVACLTLLPGYLILTPYALVVLLVLDDHIGTPLHEEQPAPGLACRITAWGWAASDEGYVVHLYRLSPILPVLRQEVRSVSVDETDQGSGPASADCAGLAKG
jgi:hypothetical protein